MLDIQRILIPTDLSPSATAAFRIARDVAEHFGAEVHVLHVRTGSGPIPALSKLLGDEPKDDAAYRQRMQEQLESKLGGYEPAFAVQREGSRTATEILDYADSADVDLIVMGTHGHRSLDHPALGGTTGDVVRNASSPVLTVRIRDDDEIAFGGFKRIIAAVDFAEHSDDVLRWAKDLARTYQARLAMIFVAEEHRVPIFSDTGMMSVTTLKLDEEIVSRSGAALRQLDGNTGPQIPDTTYEVRRGNPAQEIADFADDPSSDLVVVGRRGHSVHEGLLLGTVTEHLVRRIRCPVLTLGLAP